MADFDKPDNLSDYATVWDYVKGVQNSLALWLDGTTDTNIPTGAKRYSSTNRRFETFNGTSWAPLIALDADQANAYQIRVAKANEADSVGVATNALNLGGTAASQFVQTSDARMTDARQCNNTFGSAATSRAALSVYSQAEITASLALKANVESPALTGNPTCPTQAMGNNSTRMASTAFVSAAVAALSSGVISVGSWVDISSLLSSGWSGVARFRYVNIGGSPAAVFLDIDVYKDASTSSATIIDNLIGQVPGLNPSTTQMFVSAAKNLSSGVYFDVVLYNSAMTSPYTGDLRCAMSTLDPVTVSLKSMYWLS